MRNGQAGWSSLASRQLVAMTILIESVRDCVEYRVVYVFLFLLLYLILCELERESCVEFELFFFFICFVLCEFQLWGKLRFCFVRETNDKIVYYKTLILLYYDLLWRGRYFVDIEQIIQTDHRSEMLQKK